MNMKNSRINFILSPSYTIFAPEHQEQIHLSDAIKKFLIPSDKWSENVAMYNAMIVALIH